MLTVEEDSRENEGEDHNRKSEKHSSSSPYGVDNLIKGKAS